MLRKTKIIATLGPASQSPEMLKSLVSAGVNIFRLNMSHAPHDWCKQVTEAVRAEAAAQNANVAMLMDLKGPTIRTGDVPTPYELKPGDQVEFLLREATPTLPIYTTVNYPDLYKDLHVGDTVLVDNGVLEMKALSLDKERVLCQVLNEGTMGSRRHINLPGVKVNLPPLGRQDYGDLDLAAELGIEWVAMSFVRDASHLLLLRHELSKREMKSQIIAKFEDQQAVMHQTEIIDATDAVMVARGDLGIEVPYEELPIIQRSLVRECIKRNRRVIVATHMLESMGENPVPTRAEVSDVANAVLEQTDAIMLSGETSSGQFPLRCVQVMDRIAKRMEQEIEHSAGGIVEVLDDKQRVVRAAVQLADSFNHASILVFTKRGIMARYTAQFRPRAANIFAFCPDPQITRSLALARGVYSYHLPFSSGDGESAMESGLAMLRSSGHIEPGSTVIIISDVLHTAGNADGIWVRQA
jgi:pyruvate kinase